MFINDHKIGKGSKIITKQKNVYKRSQNRKMFKNNQKIEKCLKMITKQKNVQN